jgi:hypothetical protein
MAMRRFHMYAPLQEFPWDGNHVDVAPGIHLDRRQDMELGGREKELARDEQSRLRDDLTQSQREPTLVTDCRQTATGAQALAQRSG